ncbi:MAG TPA: response regulator transcription factor [bacterium]|nr:response regulator transcription factor [bacterium]
MSEAPSKVRLLVADDDSVLRHTLANLLAMTDGVEIVGEAADGDEAVELAVARQAGVVLMDIGMPRCDGIAATRRLAERAPNIKVVILTIYADDDRVFRALQAGARGYLLKDAAPDEIVRAVRAVHDGEGILHPGLVGRVIREFTRVTERDPEREQRFSELTAREREVLDLLACGLRNQDIAARLAIAEKTVKHHISNILSKLRVNHRTEAAILASRLGLGRHIEAR